MSRTFNLCRLFDRILTQHSDTISLRASIYNYVLENGRTYHSYRAGGEYYPPNPL